MSQHIRIFLFLPAQTKFSNRSKDQKSVAHSFAVSIFRLQKINNELLPSFRRRCFCCCTAPPPPLLLLPPPLLLLCCCAAPFAVLLLIPRCYVFRSDRISIQKKEIIRLENEVGTTRKINHVVCILWIKIAKVLECPPPLLQQINTAAASHPNRSRLAIISITEHSHQSRRCQHCCLPSCPKPSSQQWTPCT